MSMYYRNNYEWDYLIIKDRFFSNIQRSNNKERVPLKCLYIMFDTQVKIKIREDNKTDLQTWGRLKHVHKIYVSISFLWKDKKV
jgi:hypothetical protein